jgi:hypothetical protein
VALKLSIDIEARFAKALDSFDKLEKQASGSLRRVEGAVAKVNKALGIIGVGVSVGALAASFKATVDELAALDDAAEETGASVEALSSLLNTLSPTGVGLDRITELAGRLTKSMIGAGEESSKAGEAFRALGVQTRDASGNFRSVDEVLVDVAKALAQYEDGANKTALAQAALGRGGQQYLPLLKDLATRQREAATVTAEQAAKAETLANSFRELGTQATQFRQGIANSVIPTLLEFITQLNEGTKAAGGFWAALFSFGTDNPFKTAGEQLNDLREKRSELQRQIERERQVAEAPAGSTFGRGARERAAENVQRIEREITAIQKKIGYYSRLQQAAVEFSDADLDARDLRIRRLQIAPKVSDDQENDRRRAQTGAERLLESLRSQVQRTEELTEVESVLAQIRTRSIDGLTPKLREQILAQATLLDLARDAEEAVKREDAARKELQRTIEDLTRSEEIEARTKAEALVPEDIQLQVRAWKEYKSLVAGSVVEQQKLTQAIFDVIGAQQELGQVAPETADELRKQLLGIRELPPALDAVKDSAAGLLAPVESAFEAIITKGGKARDILAALADDIARLLLRQQITGPLFDLLGGTFDSKKSGGTIVGGIAKLLGFAGGGDPPVGRWSVVGEKGPELIRPLSAMRVYPSGYGPAGGGSGVVVNQTVNVGSGVNRTEVAQAMYAAKEAAKAEILASMRRGSTFAAA